MSRFHGRQHKGAQRDARAVRRQAAEQRSAATLPERTAQFRRVRAHVQAALADARTEDAA